MAMDRDIGITIRVKADGTAVIEQVAGKLDHLGDSATTSNQKTESLFSTFTKSSIVANAVSGVLSTLGSFAIQTAGRMLELGDSLAETQAGFEGLANKAGIDAVQALEAMRVGSEGLMTDIELMQAGSAMLGTGLEMTAQQMGDLTAAAKTLGEVHGVELPQALDMFTSAIQSGNDKALLALGVDLDLKAVTDALGDSATEAEKKQAVLNAVLEQSKVAAEGAAAGQGSLNDNIAKVTVAWNNWLAETGKAINESETLSKALDIAVGVLKTWYEWIKLLGPAVSWLGGVFSSVFGAILGSIKSAVEGLILMAKAVENMPGFGWAKDMRIELEDLISGFEDTSTAADNVGKTVPTAMAKAAQGADTATKSVEEHAKAHEKVIKAVEIEATKLDNMDYYLRRAGVAYDIATSRSNDFGYSLEDIDTTLSMLELEAPAAFDAAAIGMQLLADESATASDQIVAANQDAAQRSESAWKQFSNLMAGVFQGIGRDIASAIMGTGGWVDVIDNAMGQIGDFVSDKLGKYLSDAFAGIGGTMGAILGPIGGMLGSLAGSLIGGIVGIFKKLFGGRSPESAAIEETMKAFGMTIGKGTAAEIAKAVSAAFGGITGGDLENKIAIGIYLPEAQMILLKEQFAKVTTEMLEQWAKNWDGTKAVLMNDLGKTEAEAAAAMQTLMQTALDALKKNGGAIGVEMANLIQWAAKLGVEFDLVGLKVKDAMGNLVDATQWLLKTAGVEIWAKSWTDALTQLNISIENWKGAKDFEKRVAGVATAITDYVKLFLDKIRAMIKAGVDPEQIKQIAAQSLPTLKLMANYSLVALQQMQNAGMGTTEIWNSVGESMKKQLILMQELGLKGTKIYKDLNAAYIELKNNAQTIAGVTGPLVGYFQELGAQGKITADNFEKYAGMAMTYIQRLKDAGATSSEIWTAMSGIFDVLKKAHDDVFSDLQTKMQSVFDKTKGLSTEAQVAIEAYVLAGKGSLEQLAAMGVPKSLLDQIQAWRDMAGEVDGPVYQALQKYYDQQKKLQGVTALMDQINALFTAMGSNVIKNKGDLKIWSEEIEGYFRKMINGGMTLSQITAQYGGTMHQLYLKYQAMGENVPGWLKKIEKEYQLQEAARKAADDAQRAAQIAMLEGFAALIKVIGGEVPAAITDAIKALQKLRDEGKDPIIVTFGTKTKLPKGASGLFGGGGDADAIAYINQLKDSMKILEAPINTKVDLSVPTSRSLGQFSVDADKVQMRWTPLERGLAYVPYDNYPALLHRGERVVTAADNAASAGGSSQRDVATNINITISAIDTQGMEDAVRNQVIPILKRAIADNTGGIGRAVGM